VKISPDEIVTWLIVGALAGSLTGMLIRGRKEGFGHVLNLAIGLVGALIGGYLFKVLHVSLGLLGQITISLQEVVAALVGSLIFLAAIWLVRRQLGRK
jgi:uncharacterized membrane protein YeaQ/YmgE (transglycosylase-associated protein family)